MPKPPQDPRHVQLPEKLVEVRQPPLKVKKEDNWPVSLRVRSYEGLNMVDVWIIRGKGITSALLHGQMLGETAALLADKLGISVEREHR